MALSVKFLGCNAGCASCYENRIRKNHSCSYDINKILETLKQVVYGEIRERKKSGTLRSFRCTDSPTIHGGEPLLMKVEDIEEILFFVHSFFGRSGIQTNLTLLNDKHIELFKRYKTNVGISIDGDTAELNRGRFSENASIDVVREETALIIRNIRRLKEAGLEGMSCIIVLRKYNANSKNISSLMRFIRRLRDEFGITDIRTNPGIVFDERLKEKEQLTQKELARALIKTTEISGVKVQPYRDVVELMMGHNSASCNFSECDPWKTSAEIPVSGDGEIGNCLKSAAAQDGIQSLASDYRAEVRYRMLEKLPIAEGGCKDCRYWFICKGGCPGAGVDNDYRNKTRFCKAYKDFFKYVETQIKNLFPSIILKPDLFPENPNSQDVLSTIQNTTWRDSSEQNIEMKKGQLIHRITMRKSQGQYTGDHGDSSHGDSHGDSNDPEWRRRNPWWTGKIRRNRI